MADLIPFQHLLDWEPNINAQPHQCSCGLMEVNLCSQVPKYFVGRLPGSSSSNHVFVWVHKTACVCVRLSVWTCPGHFPSFCSSSPMTLNTDKQALTIDGLITLALHNQQYTLLTFGGKVQCHTIFLRKATSLWATDWGVQRSDEFTTETHWLHACSPVSLWQTAQVSLSDCTYLALITPLSGTPFRSPCR